MWAKTTIGVEVARPLRSFSSHSSCSLPRLPSPPVEVDHVDEADEMHAVRIEAVPARALGAATVAVAVELHVLVEDVVLARHIMHVEPRLRDDAIGVVEFRWFREMGDVASVNEE